MIKFSININKLLIIGIVILFFGCKKNPTSPQNTTPTPNKAPIANFTINPPSGTTATAFNFDANISSDNEDAISTLQVRWDYGDGTNVTNYSTNKTATHQYDTQDTYTVTLKVKDSGGLNWDSNKICYCVFDKFSSSSLF